MKKSPMQTAMGVALGTALIGTLSMSAYAATDTSPFQMKALSSGYMVAGGEDRSGDSKSGKKSMEGKCGGKKGMEGKCGGKKGMLKGIFGGANAPMAPATDSMKCVYDEDMCR